MTFDPQKAKAIFLEAVEHHEPDQWARYLEQACGEDLELRQWVDELLKAHPGEDSLLDRAGRAETVDQTLTEKPGTQIGPYKLLEQIGEGGMGVVYMAEQSDPVERRVALKIIKPGMDTRQVIARFEVERQALAMMDHPNIARVLDAGQTDAGRPYFVMELVKGVPVTEYCDQQQLTLRQRLELFLPICQAIQHAHQKGIIHRDIKPSNVLVALFDGRPVPKVIDFGVAKAIGGRLTEKTMFTQFGQIIGTLEYMSPEQAQLDQFDIDTRSDVYSLGVLLYELLTGATPFDKQSWRDAGFDEIRRIIREDDPPRPSDRVSTLAAEAISTVSEQRRSVPRKLGFALRGELDWIVMKALEKERGRRYETAAAFAADVQRYLDDAPVLACPPSLAYRFKKLARRNKVALSLSSFAVVSLLALTVGALSYAFSIQKESRQRIDVNRKIGDAIAELRQYEDRAQNGALDDKDAWFVATRAVERAETLAKDDLADPDLVRRVGEAVAGFQEAGANRALVLKLEAIRDELGGEAVSAGFSAGGQQVTKPEYAAVFREHGIPPRRMEPADAATRITAKPPRVRDALTIALWVWSGYERSVRANLSEDEHAEAEWGRQVLAALESDPWRRRLLDYNGDRRVLIALAEDPSCKDQPPHALLVLGSRLCYLGREFRDRGIAVLKWAQRQYPDDYWLNFKLSEVSKDGSEALRYASIAVALKPKSAQPVLRLGSILEHLGRADEALAVYQDALAGAGKTEFIHRAIGRLYEQRGDLDAAAAEYRLAVDNISPLSGWLRLQDVYADLKRILERTGRTQELFEFLKATDAKHPDNPEFRAWLADYHYQQGDWSEAADLLLATDEADHGGLTAHGRASLAAALVSAQRLDEARREYRRLVEEQQYWFLAGNTRAEIDSPRIMGSVGGVSIDALQQAADLLPRNARAQSVLGIALFKDDRIEEAVKVFRRATSLDPKDFSAAYNLAQALGSEGEFEEAIEQFQRAVDLNTECATFWLNYGKTLQSAGRHEEAIAAFQRCFDVADSRYRRYLEGRKLHPEIKTFIRPYPDWFYDQFFSYRWAKEALTGFARSQLEIEPAKDAMQTIRRRLLELAASSDLFFERNTANAWILLGEIDEERKDSDAAMEAYREAIKEDPKLARGYQCLAQLLIKRNRSDEAVDLLEKALELQPRNLTVQNMLEEVKRKTTVKSDVDKQGQTRPMPSSAVVNPALEHGGGNNLQDLLTELRKHRPVSR